MRTPDKIIHCIANCQQCDWQEQDYLTAPRKAAAHHRKTQHSVLVEKGVTYRLIAKQENADG